MAKQKQESNAQTWQWRESKTVKHQDELRLGDHVEATLRWEGLLSNLATARAPAGQWTFDRPRLLSRDIEVREIRAGEDSAPLIAVYYQKWTGEGTLKLADGRAYDWAPTNFWQTRWAFFDADERPLIVFDDTSGLLEHRTEVTFHRIELSKADVGLLATLGRCLMTLKRQDAAAIVATTAVTAAT